MRSFDVIVVGQGLAGTTLAWSLRCRGVRGLVIDRDERVTASRIAAGLITPVTGQRLVKQARWEGFWTSAVRFYREIERETGTGFFREGRMLRLFANDGERAVFERRVHDGQFDGLHIRRDPEIDEDTMAAPHGGFEMPGGQLDVRTFLEASRCTFSADGGFQCGEVKVPDDLEMHPEGVDIPRLGVTAPRLVFCQGYAGAANPMFQHVPWDATQGEILTLAIPGCSESRVIHRGVWLAPVEKERYLAGSTYQRERLDGVATDRGEREICDRLREFLRRDFRVIDRAAAARPIVRGRRPVVGLHPQWPAVGFFNGLASKAALQAPWLAERFSEVLLGGGALEAEFDLNRFSVDSSKHGRSASSRRSGRLTSRAQDAIRDVLRPGDPAIDATAGNGHDTLFLAESVGSEGVVYAFDVQPEALERTAERVRAAGFSNVVLLEHDHANLATAIPDELYGRIGAVMFNLGYLPGGDTTRTTQSASTLKAVRAALDLLRPGGVMTLLAYTGHPGGAEEADAVSEALSQRPPNHYEVRVVEVPSGARCPPRLFVVKKLS